MYVKRIIWGVLLCLCGALGLSTLPPLLEYAYPIDPYYTLAGTFGELRSNHFHAGIDVKTLNRIGIPIKAVADGYVSRINDMPGGYGRAIYLRHPDGNYSVYGHLSGFMDTLETVLYLQQLEDQQYNQQIYLPKDQIKVKKGQIIGYSGNSGSSYGPHLHFEIRDKNERILNPFVYFKDKFTDNIRPQIQFVSFIPLKINSRVNGKYQTRQMRLSGGGGKYKVLETVKVEGPIGLGYKAYDLLNGAPNRCGINYAQLFLDDSLIYAFRLDTFGFDETRNINMHIDYGNYQTTRSKFQRAFVAEGNALPAYDATETQGIIQLQDSFVHSFRLVLKDYHGNESKVTGNIQLSSEPSSITYRNYGNRKPEVRYVIEGDMMQVKVKYPSQQMQEQLMGQYQTGQAFAVKPSYQDQNEYVYLLPLDRFDYPQFVEDTANDMRWTLGDLEKVFPDQNNLIRREELKLFFPYQSVFHPVHVEIRREPMSGNLLTDAFTIGDNGIPLRSAFVFGVEVADTVETDKWMLVKWSKNKWNVAGTAQRSGNYVYAATRNFGKYAMMHDTIPPILRTYNFGNGGTFGRNDKEIILFVNDVLSGIHDNRIEGRIDGEWVPFRYDYKRDRIIYNFTRNRPSKGKHLLQVKVFDHAGNETTKDFTVYF